MGQYVLTEYQMSGPRRKLALLADIHESGSDELLHLVAGSRPDIICIAGDTFERYGVDSRKPDPRCEADCGIPYRVIRRTLMFADDVVGFIFGGERADKQLRTEETYRFLRALREIAPVYMGLGNHDWRLRERDRSVLGDIGIVVLDNRDVEVGGIRIGGLSSGPDWGWLERYSKKPGYKILLSHHPERFSRIKDINLILSGHAHGGQIRIRDRGIYAPNQGLFPRYTKGVYEGAHGSKMVVSTGCSNTASVPRLGNPCEVAVVELG